MDDKKLLGLMNKWIGLHPTAKHRFTGRFQVEVTLVRVRLTGEWDYTIDYICDRNIEFSWEIMLVGRAVRMHIFSDCLPLFVDVYQYKFKPVTIEVYYER